MLLALDRGGAVPLHRQIYTALRGAILDAKFRPGRRLPSTRTLAADLGVSRTTVLGAYDQLAAEGFIKSRSGGGSRVAEVAATAPDRRPAPRGRRNVTAFAAPPVSAVDAATLAFYERGGNLSSRADANVAPSRPGPVPFTLGIPALGAFPVKTWARLSARHWRRSARNLMLPSDGAGYRPLREAIAEYTFTARGVRCQADQVIVTAGATQGIALTARLLLEPGNEVWMEEPGFAPARAAFTALGARVVSVPVDRDGLDVAQGTRAAPHARLAFVTPSFQAPTGAVMSLERRLALLDWAAARGGWIVEDDYNGEFRYDGRPLASLQGLEHRGGERIIYLGTFSKTVFPALRLGYAIVPEALIDAFAVARLNADRHSPVLEQAVLADFIHEGHFARHVRAMRGLYAERQRTLVDLAREELDGLIRIEAAPAGMRLLGSLPSGVRDLDVAAQARRRGIDVAPLSQLCVERPGRNALLLGYAPFGPAEIRRGLRALRECIRECMAQAGETSRGPSPS